MFFLANAVVSSSTDQINGELESPLKESEPITPAMNQKDFHCEVCDVKYTTKRSLDRHKKAGHGLFQCVVCDTLAKSMEEIRHHIQSVHYEGQELTDEEFNERIKSV